MSFTNCYKNKRVLVTGHTGFKGSWLSEWLILLGAKVYGYSLEPPTTPSHYELTDLSSRLTMDVRGDIRDYGKLAATIKDIQPEFVFHLAAQPIVRLSYRLPVETYETNAMGTLNMLNALREVKDSCVAVMITTDKVYENREWLHAYRESDPLGGYDPYSASKACAELIIASYFKSFFLKDLLTGTSPMIAVASARAGNVIGGGDWAEDRIVPDCIRYLEKNENVPVRNKNATRPWQHVMEPLGGYLLLGARMYEELHNSGKQLPDLCSAFNFGPTLSSHRTVLELVNEILKYWPGQWEDRSDADAPHEAGKLNLACDKVFHMLHWQPQWGFERTVKKTVEWYLMGINKRRDPSVVRKCTVSQIEEYSQMLSH